MSKSCMRGRGGDWPEMPNSWGLAEEDERTVIRERAFYPSKEARDAALETRTKEGASPSLNHLVKHLKTIA